MRLTDIQILIFIIMVSAYHFYIHNTIEKTFSRAYFDYDTVKRPLFSCDNRENSSRLKCIGMPSGHAETSSVFAFLLYFYKIIPLWLCLLFILVISLQRITSHMHTLGQVIIGAILGYIYANIYDKIPYGFVIIIAFGILLASLSVNFSQIRIVN